MDSGSGWPSSSFSFGLGSKRSIWLGAPAMKMQMQALAFGSKSGFFGARGFVHFRQLIGMGQNPVLKEHRRQGKPTDAAGRRGQKLPPGFENAFDIRFHAYSLVINSSRFMITRAKAT